MHIDPSWRILTIGDGDLSFSRALYERYRSLTLQASVYDSETTVLKKYKQNELRSLRQNDITVHTEIDITNPASFYSIPSVFDLVIFQFPLINRCSNKEEYQQRGNHDGSNLLNRRLLRSFLINSFQYFLDKRGQRLCYITSKDVKPFYDWDIENAINRHLDIPFLGSMPFNRQQFPGYRVRNVNRDTIIADTGATTYVWGDNANTDLLDQLKPPAFQSDNCCSMCRAGPFSADEDRIKHYQSKRHITMQTFEDAWNLEVSTDK